MGGEQSRLKPRDAQPSENTKRRRPVRNTLKKILAYVTVAATFGATGALSRAVRAEQARAVEEDEAVTQRRALAREAAESLRSLMRERSTEGAERFLEIIDEQAADPEFHTELERQIQSLIRVDGEGGATPEDAFIAAWAEEYAEDGRIEYDLLVQDIQLLHAAAYEAVDALRNFLITGDTDERTRFEDSFRREFLGQPARANLFYTRAFADGFQHRLRDDEGAHAIERAYALSTSRAGRALHACYEQAAEAGSVEDAPEALVAEHGAEFVRLFIELRDELGLSGQSENAMILFFEDHEDEPGEDADDDYRTAHGRASRLLRALGFNISGLVRDVSAVYMAFEGDERPDAEETRELERQFGRRLVELVEERAAPAEVDEEEESRRERRYQLLLSDAFSAFINMDTLIQPGETSLQTSTLERYERTYERSPVTQQVAFGRWAADALGAWDRLDHNDLAQVRRYFRQYFPRLPMPSEEHLPRFNVAMTVMSAHVRYGSFRFESYMTQLRDSADAFASYLAVCSRRDSVSWTGPMQEAFTATVIERSQAARRGRLPREVRIPEGGGAGADLANELIPAVTRSLGEADREEEVRLLQARVLIADMFTETIFGYDWEVIEDLRLGDIQLFDSEGRERMGRLTGVAKLAELHRSIMESSEFERVRTEYIQFIASPETTTEIGQPFEIPDVGEEVDIEEAESRLDGSRYLDMLDYMDPLAQFAFFAVAFPAVRDETGLTMLEEVEGEEDSGRAEERDATSQERMIYVLDEIEVLVRTTGRGGHVGFMLYAVPLAIEYSDTYNSVVTILNAIIGTASTISNTSMYDYFGRGRALFMYTMEQVPRNFDEANNDSYNQLIDMMLRNPTASNYTSDDMDRDMFDTQMLGEMLGRFIDLTAARSGAIRPSYIHPRRAPQDFSLAGALTIMEDDTRLRAGRNYGTLISGLALMDDEEREQTIQEMIDQGRDEELQSWWRNNVDMHTEFLNFFRPDSVSIIPERSYRVTSFIPMSISSLLRRLSSLEGVDRLAYPIDVRSARGYLGVGVDHASYDQISGGSEGDRQVDQTEGRGGGQLTAAIWGPRQEITLDAGLDYSTAADLEDMSETERWSIEQSLFERDMPLFTEELTGRSRFSATESFSTDTSESPYRRLVEVTDVALLQALDWYARRHDTDGALYISGLENGEVSGREEEDGTWTEETESRHDWRVHSYAKIHDRWYRVGYIDVSEDSMRRFFVGMQVPERWRDFGEARVLVGSEPRRGETPGEIERDVEVSEGTQLEGMLVGINLSNLFAFSSPVVTLANIENFGRAVDDLMEELPEEQQGDLEMRRMEEFANGLSLLFRDHDAIGRAGFVRTTGFVVATARRYRRTVITDTPTGDDVEEVEHPDDWTGGAGAIVQMTGPREDSDRATIEMALAVEESIGTSAIREVNVQTTGVGEDGSETVTYEWRPASTELAEGEEIVGERRTYVERQERLGATLGWRSANFGVTGLHTLAMVNTEAFEDARGLLGFMYDNNEEGERHTNTFGMFGGQYDPFYENHEIHSIYGLERGNTRIQFTGLYSHMELISRLDEVNTLLNSAYREIADLRTGGVVPEHLPDAASRSERISQLEREIEAYSTMRTALGVIGCQKFFGTAQWVQQFGPRTRTALEALYGGFDEHHLMLNGWVEVDELFAASYNMTAMPFGSAGGKVVVPIREITLAALGGGYWRDDEEGGSGYGGLLWTRSDERYGLGAIIGGGTRTSTVISDDEEEEDLSVETTRAEAMVLGWHPVGRARMQHYIVLSWEGGSNVWQMDALPASDLTTWKFGAGTLVRWVDRRGRVWRGRLDLLYRHMEEMRVGSPERFDRDTVSVQGGLEVTPTEGLNLRIMLGIHNTDDVYTGPTTEAGEDTVERRLQRLRMGGMGICEWEF